MIIVDAHCDTITKIMETQENLNRNGCHVDIERIKGLGSFVQFFAAFIDPLYYTNPSKRALQIIDKFYEEIKNNKNFIAVCTSYRDIRKAHKEEKIAAILSIEGGEALQGDLALLRSYYRLGVRSICLTWNNRNDIADGIMDDYSCGGLSRYGMDVVEEMNKLGMIIDVSHISEKGFFDVIWKTTKPIIASHSNTRKICNHPRNHTDKQIKAIKGNKGVIGLNFYNNFLDDKKRASIKDIIRHIEYIAGLIGIDYIGLGADFDGVDVLPEGIDGVQDLDKIINELLRLNYKNIDVDKIMGGNMLRLIKRVFAQPKD